MRIAVGNGPRLLNAKREGARARIEHGKIIAEPVHLAQAYGGFTCHGLPYMGIAALPQLGCATLAARIRQGRTKSSLTRATVQV
jgi:hypothetical protein